MIIHAHAECKKNQFLKLLGGMLFLLAYVIIHPAREKVPKKHNFFNVPQDKQKKDPDRVFTSITLATFIRCKESVFVLKLPQSVMTI